MAYEVKPQKDDQNPDQADPNALPMAGAVGLGAAPTTAAPSTTSAPTQPASKFVNFDRVLSANKDTAEAAANQLTGRLQTQAQGAQSALTGVVSNFGDAVKAGAGTTTPVQHIQAPGAPTNLTGVMLGSSGAAGGTAPAAPTLAPRLAPTTPPNLAAMGGGVAAPAVGAPRLGGAGTPQAIGQPANDRFAQATYTGPNDISEFAGWKDALAQQRKSDQDLTTLTSPGGLGAFAKDQAGGGANYTAGMQNMDAALLGAVGGGRYNDLAQKYGNLGALVDKAGNEGNAKVTAARRQVNAYNKSNTAKQADLDAQKAKAVETKAAASKDPEGDAMVSKIPGFDPNYQKGAWGQADIGAAGSWIAEQGDKVAGDFGAHKDDSNRHAIQEVSDAGRFAHVMKDAGYSEDEAHAMYENMSPADIQEMNWILNGPTGNEASPIPGDPTGPASSIHPYYSSVGGGSTTEQIKTATDRWLDRMRTKYGF